MRITRLELENWMGIPQLQLDFSPGMNLVYGRNEIGKSSIIESIYQAILGDASVKKAEYKSLVPWGTEIKAHVKLSFTANGQEYQLDKSFPNGDTALYHRGVKIADEAKKAREKLFTLLDISEKTTNLLRLLFINQGESLNIFEKKGSPLDDNTKSYIKEVIKESTFKELQLFQNQIDTMLNVYFPPERKSVKKSSQYAKLIEKEKELANVLDELTQKEEQLQGKITEIDQVDVHILRLQEEAQQQNTQLQVLKTKKERLQELEKKELIFTPVQKDYDLYMKMKWEADDIFRRLPLLLANRYTRIAQQKKQLGELEKEKNHAQEALKKLKLKKQEGERIQQQARIFEKIQADYNDIKKMDRQTQDMQQDLPQILAQSLHVWDIELKKLSEKLQLRARTEEEFHLVESQLQELPKITQKEITELRKMELEISKLADKIASFREELKLNFRLTPLHQRKIPYTIETGDNQTNTGTTGEPMEISGFQKLRFTYPEHLDIHITGNLAKTDFEALHHSLLVKKEPFTTQLAAFNVATVADLEKKNEEITAIKNKRDHIKATLAAFEKRTELEKQIKEISDTMVSKKQDFQKYLGDNGSDNVSSHAGDNSGDTPLPGYPRSLEETNPLSIHHLNQQLSQAKASLDSFQSRKEQILETYQLTFMQLESNYLEQKNQLQKQQEDYRHLEPMAVETVTDTDLEKAVSHINALDKKSEASQSEIKLLEEMGPLPQDSLKPEERPSLPQSPSHTTLTSQQLRDEIKQALNRRLDLEQKQQELLRELTEEEFKKNHFRMSEELKTLQEEIKHIPPLHFAQSKDIKEIEKEIMVAEVAIKSIYSQSVDKEKLRERWLGETADFSQTIEEKNDKEIEYRHVLVEVKKNIAEIASLQLLDLLINQEKDKAQQEVFKPLQERVVNTFSTLVGDRYKILLDNDLNLDVAGRTFTGDYQTGVDHALSFGTKEQLSFIFRLAIATELSRQEPGVMVLDDSFVNTDTLRFPLLMDILNEQATNLQFLVFTCRPADYLAYFPTAANPNLRCINLEEEHQPK